MTELTIHESIHESILETVGDDGPMAVLRKRPAEAKSWPVVVMFHDGPGMRDATHKFASQLAGCGYEVIVPDLYHRHGRMIGFGPKEIAADPDAPTKIFEMLMSITDDGIQHDLDTALDALAAQHQSEGRGDNNSAAMGCIGFCLGARAVFRTMMRLPEQFVAGAMWHPSFLVDDQPDSPHLTADQLTGKLYAGFAELDQLMTVASMKPFIDAVSGLGDRVRVDILADADHGFTWPDDPQHHNAAAAHQAWDATLEMFSSTLNMPGLRALRPET